MLDIFWELESFRNRLIKEVLNDKETSDGKKVELIDEYMNLKYYSLIYKLNGLCDKKDIQKIIEESKNHQIIRDSCRAVTEQEKGDDN